MTMTQPKLKQNTDGSTTVPHGYRRTEVGVVPDDWEVKSLGEIGNFSKGKGIKRNDVSDEGVGCIRYGELYTRYNNYVLKPVSRIPQSVAASALPIMQGDLLFAGSGETAEEIGKCVAYLCEEEAYAGGDIVVLRPSGHNSLYLGHLLNHDAVAQQKARFGQGDAVVHVSARNLAMVKLPLPPEKGEQDAIAGVLSDVDGLIGGLDKLIAKKRDIKLAAMQQLLTGKTRLPGFADKWEEKPLSELAAITMGQSPPSQFYNLRGYGFPLIQGNADIKDHLTIERVWTTKASKRCDVGDLLLTVRAPVGALGVATKAACLGRGVCGLKPCASSQFLFQALVFAELRWKILEQGSTFTSANSKQVGQFRVRVPEDCDEQTAIATVLSDMDAEINALKRRQKKTKQIKQGMMQSLLTGRVRLANPPEAEAKA